MIKAGILVSILLLLIGSVYAGNNISNNTSGTNQSSDESPDESLNYTEDDVMNAIGQTDNDSGEYIDDINMVEGGKYPNTPIGTKPSPGFESIIVIMTILLMTIIKANKR